jgi:hypothetical protein
MHDDEAGTNYSVNLYLFPSIRCKGNQAKTVCDYKAAKQKRTSVVSSKLRYLYIYNGTLKNIW